jgi:hypothetical protein
MLAPQLLNAIQIPMIQLVESDDEILLNSPEAEWFQILTRFFSEDNWVDYRDFAAKYYDSLFDFNFNAARDKELRAKSVPCGETQEEAIQRLLFDRVTMKDLEDESTKILHEIEKAEVDKTVGPNDIAPGVVPIRLAGKKPKCFFSLFAAFLGTNIMGFRAEPDLVHKLLLDNPSFARVCQFVPKGVKDNYFYKHVPSLRKLEQFDQIMTSYGIWNRIKLDEVRSNISTGIISMEEELVGDTSHYYSYSGFETVEYLDENGKKQKKSQSKVTKNCRCEDRTACNHPWELADEGSGTVVKSKTKMYWAHKASIIGYPTQGIPLDAVAVSDGATFDGKTFYPHVEKLFQEIPEVKDSIHRVLYDSACDDKDLKEKFWDDFQVELKASMNPRRKKDVVEDLPRGMEKITPYGVPICKAAYEMDYQGIRYDSEKFIFKAPKDSEGNSVCKGCAFKTQCCPNAQDGRALTIGFDTLPNIDPEDPPMAKRFKAIMKRRPSVERMIKRLKCDLGDDRLSKRGNASFQASLDKSMIAFHVLIRHV